MFWPSPSRVKRFSDFIYSPFQNYGHKSCRIRSGLNVREGEQCDLSSRNMELTWSIHIYTYTAPNRSQADYYCAYLMANRIYATLLNVHACAPQVASTVSRASSVALADHDNRHETSVCLEWSINVVAWFCFIIHAVHILIFIRNSLLLDSNQDVAETLPTPAQTKPQLFVKFDSSGCSTSVKICENDKRMLCYNWASSLRIFSHYWSMLHWCDLLLQDKNQ